MELDRKETEMLFVWMRRLETKVDSLRDDMREVKTRLSSVETQVAGLRTDVNHQWEQFGAHALRLERLEMQAGLIGGEHEPH